MVYKASLIFDHAHQIIIKLLAFLNLYQHAKIIFETLQILESWDLQDHTYFWSKPSRNY